MEEGCAEEYADVAINVSLGGWVFQGRGCFREGGRGVGGGLCLGYAEVVLKVSH